MVTTLISFYYYPKPFARHNGPDQNFTAGWFYTTFSFRTTIIGG